MENQRDYSSSGEPGAESTIAWILGVLGVGIIAALLVVTIVPDNVDRDVDRNGASTGSEQVIPNTPPPVRTE